MKKIDKLAQYLKDEVFESVGDYWEEATLHAKIRIFNSGDFEYIIPRQKQGRSFVSSGSRGVYMWITKDTALYVGKTDAASQNINLRQGAHLRSFKKSWVKSESSGRKLREYLAEKDLHEEEIVILYIDMIRLEQLGVASLIEDATIKHYKPLLNREIKGRGSRNATHN
jgi:hypothetical protein